MHILLASRYACARHQALLHAGLLVRPSASLPPHHPKSSLFPPLFGCRCHPHEPPCLRSGAPSRAGSQSNRKGDGNSSGNDAATFWRARPTGGPHRNQKWRPFLSNPLLQSGTITEMGPTETKTALVWECSHPVSGAFDRWAAVACRCHSIPALAPFTDRRVASASTAVSNRRWKGGGGGEKARRRVCAIYPEFLPASLLPHCAENNMLANISGNRS